METNSKFLNWLKQISTHAQSATKSFTRHNSQYEKSDALEKEAGYARYNNEHDILNRDEYKMDMLLNAHPEVRAVAVDIGSGAGWFSYEFSQNFKKVISIEPSAAAINISKTLYPPEKYPNIEWHQGFAEQVLGRIKLDQPALFFTGVVLSHLRDSEASLVCAAVNKLAMPGSLLCFSECWGPEFHQLMWHVRTQEWWQQQLPGWELDFNGPAIQDVPGRHKGIHGVKK